MNKFDEYVGEGFDLFMECVMLPILAIIGIITIGPLVLLFAGIGWLKRCFIQK